MHRAVMMLSMFAIVAAGWCATGASAVQHLVDPGDNWEDLAQRLRPGDEIVLMPGNHRPGSLANVRGTSDRPITIRSLNMEFPATIRADRYGIQLRGVQYVHIRDLFITGASINAIEISAMENDSAPCGNITIRDVTIERTGPIGRRHAIHLVGLREVNISRSHFRAWGGSAISIVNSQDVAITNCTFEGDADFGQINAIHVRGGSERVRITRCTMIDAGVTAISLGGRSEPTDFSADAEQAQRGLFEARRVRVTTNVIKGGLSAVAFLNCDECHVRNNTILRPQRWAYMFLDGDQTHLAPTRNSTFAVNLIHWDPGDLKQWAHAHKDRDASGLVLEQNLWWSADLASTKSRLGDFAGNVQFPQLTDIDPSLDENHVPTESRAAMFGYDTP